MILFTLKLILAIGVLSLILIVGAYLLLLWLAGMAFVCQLIDGALCALLDWLGVP